NDGNPDPDPDSLANVSGGARHMPAGNVTARLPSGRLDQMGSLRSNIHGTQHLSNDGVEVKSGQMPNSRSLSLANQMGLLPSNVPGTQHLSNDGVEVKSGQMPNSRSLSLANQMGLLPSNVPGTQHLSNDGVEVKSRQLPDSKSLSLVNQMGSMPSNVPGNPHLLEGGVSEMTPLHSNVRGDKHLLIDDDDEMDGSRPLRHRNRDRRRQRQVIDTSDEDEDEDEEVPYSDLEGLSEADFQYLESHAMMQAPSTESAVDVPCGLNEETEEDDRTKTFENKVEEGPSSDLDGSWPLRHRNRGRRRQRQVIDTSDEDEDEDEEVPYSDLEGLSEADFQYLESHAMMQAPSTESAVDVPCGLNKDNPKDIKFLIWLGLESMEQTLKDFSVPVSDRAAFREAVRQRVEAVGGEASAVPEMDTDGSDSVVEEIDLDAQILDDRIDVYVSDVEDDGMELLIDEEFLKQDDVASATIENGSSDSIEGLDSEWHPEPAAQRFYDRASVVCHVLHEHAVEEVVWDSNRSAFSLNAWTWFRNAKPSRLAEIVFTYASSGTRRVLSEAVLDVMSLLSLPEPKRNDLEDSCNSAGVYVYVCHGRCEDDPRSGTNEVIGNKLVGCYTGQSIKKPMDNGRQGMSLRFDQHRREMGRTIPELEEKARKVSMNVPMFYRTVIENDLIAHPRVVATLPRDSHMAARAMLIETVIMLITGSVSEESSQGLPTQALVAEVKRDLSYEGSFKYQPQALNRALPARQGFRASVRIHRQCQQCEHNSSNYEMSFHTSQYTQQCLCRGCLRKEITERCRPELAEMGKLTIEKIPKNRSKCENPSCKKGGKSSGWSITQADYVLCKACKRAEVDEFDRAVLNSEYGTAEPVDKTQLVCGGASCSDPRQLDKKTVVWARSLIELAAGNEVWLCQPCRNSERGSYKGKKVQEDLQALQATGVVVPGLPRMPIPADKKFCHDPNCPKLRKLGHVPALKRGDAPGWSIDPAHPQWVLCSPCREQERKRLVREILTKRGIAGVSQQRLKIREADKHCTEEGCDDPHQEAVKARMESGEMIQSGHIWFRHPVEKGGRVLCAPCRKVILQKMNTEANRRARERINNPVRERKT
ncbi:hypothetical protein ACHAQD_009678, partial [Fusarium lateritium]